MDATSWKHAIDLTPTMIAYWGADLRCRLANRAYETWFGVAPEALVGRHIRDLLGPELFAKNEPYIRAALRGERQQFERLITGPDGVRRHSLALYLPDIVDGEVRGFVAHVTEVTALKETQEKLEATIKNLEEEAARRRSIEETLLETQQSLSVALDSAGAAFIASDREGRVTRLNAVAERLTGWTEAEARGQQLMEVYQREGRPPETQHGNVVEIMLRDHIEVDQTFDIEVISRQGKRTPVSAKAGLLRAPNQEPFGVAIIIKDRSNEVRALRAEESAQKWFRQLVEAAPFGLLVVDAAQRIVFANRKLQELCGYDAAALRGLDLGALIPPGSRGAHPAQVAAFQRDPSQRAMGPGRPVFALRRDGTEVAVEIGLTPLDTPEGKLTLASVVDITERKAAEDELKRSNSDLEQFAYVASHDLQEPLRMVANYTELLAERYQGQLDEKGDKYIFYAVDGARRMQRLVRDLLAYSRVGSRQLQCERLDVGKVVSRVLHGMQPSITEAGAEISVSALPTVVADEVQLAQVFQNLLSNALKFRAQAPLKVRIGAARTEGGWRFELADNGIGFEQRFADRAFQMFQRLHERGKYEGSGIGLAIVKRIVERHGGRLGATSEVGVGSTISFTLPDAREVPAASKASTDP